MSVSGTTSVQVEEGIAECVQTLTDSDSVGADVRRAILSQLNKLTDACRELGCDGRLVDCESVVGVDGGKFVVLIVTVHFRPNSAAPIVVGAVKRAIANATRRIVGKPSVEFDDADWSAAECCFVSRFECTVLESDVVLIREAQTTAANESRAELSAFMAANADDLHLDAELARATRVHETRLLESSGQSRTRSGHLRSVPTVSVRKRGTRRSTRRGPESTRKSFRAPRLGASATFAHFIKQRELGAGKQAARGALGGLLNRAAKFVGLGGWGTGALEADQRRFVEDHSSDFNLFVPV